jgi:hypothetical protein
MGRYANTGEFNVLYPTRRRMATILKRIIRDDILNPTGSTLIDSIRINAKITGGFEVLEIQIIAAYYFIYLNNGVPQTSNQYGPNNGSIVSRDFVEKFTYELGSAGITKEIYNQYFEWLTKRYPILDAVVVAEKNQKLIYTFEALFAPPEFIQGLPLRV